MTHSFNKRKDLHLPVLVSSKSVTLGLMFAIIAVLPPAGPCKLRNMREEKGGWIPSCLSSLVLGL